MEYYTKSEIVMIKFIQLIILINKCDQFFLALECEQLYTLYMSIISILKNRYNFIYSETTRY